MRGRRKYRRRAFFRSETPVAIPLWLELLLMAPNSNPSSSSDPTSLKLALAIALLRFKNHRRTPPAASSSSSLDADAHRWKRKAKERKQEVLRLREEIKQLEDGMQCDALPQIASCRCHFFEGCGGSGRDSGVCGDAHWIDEILRRRFLRLVRWKERRKGLDGSIRRRRLLEFGSDDEMEQLGTSIDFLVELSNTKFGGVASPFATFSHQAVDFILASTKNVLSSRKDGELIEKIIDGFITRLTKRMCTVDNDDGFLDSSSDFQFCIQHLMRKLVIEPFIGHRMMLSISQSISLVAESLLLMDPFDEAFHSNHDSMFMMIQLVEFLISDYMQNWTSSGEFDKRLFEEWVRSILGARKALGLLECRNGLYIIYMERVIGELARQVGPLASRVELDPDIIAHIFG